MAYGSAGSQVAGETKEIVISDIQIPFGRAVGIMLKWALAAIPAAIPAAIIVAIILLIIWALVGGVVIGLLA